jgi:hypothetical protein
MQQSGFEANSAWFRANQFSHSLMSIDGASNTKAAVNAGRPTSPSYLSTAKTPVGRSAPCQHFPRIVDHEVAAPVRKFHRFLARGLFHALPVKTSNHCLLLPDQRNPGKRIRILPGVVTVIWILQIDQKTPDE